ncbi:hypothetical protein [Thauera sp.]|uniref:hypothetical protein n=1 Tax=Thauera sp. TaxID=1905334 RepID=UPI00257BBA00|nr:hypothetical protein [Thauera sp.]
MRAELDVAASVDVALTALALGDAATASAVAWSLFERGSIRPVFAQLRPAFTHGGLESEFRDMQKRAALSRIAKEGASEQAPAAADPPVA